MRTMLYLLAATAVVVAGGTCDRPNFLLFFIDDMGYGDLGCYGRENVSTPHVDALAAEGVRFTQWLSGAPICTPSRAALHTGRLPQRLGMVANTLPFRVYPTLASTGGIPDSETTIAAAVRDLGYRTGISGKWHLGVSSLLKKNHYLPPQRGYDSWLGTPFSNMHQCNEEPAGGQGRFFCMLMANNTIVQQPLFEKNLTRELTEHAVGFIEETVAMGKPFYFMFSFLHVHTPLFTSDAFKGRSRGGVFGDNVEEMDHAVGEVMAAVKRAGVDECTLVMLTSDNGPFAEEGFDVSGSTGGLKGSKGQTWEGGIRMPGIMRWPGVIPAGAVTDAPVSTMDIYPTVMDFARGADVERPAPNPKSKPLDGKSLVSLLRNPTTTPSPHAYMFHYCGYNLAAVRQVRPGGLPVLKYHLLTTIWRNKGHSEVCTQCCPYEPTAVFGGSLCDCVVGKDMTNHTDAPVVYDITNDRNETTPLTHETFPGGADAYDAAMSQMWAAVAAHTAGMQRGKDQMYGMSPFNLPCCDGSPLKGSSCQCSKPFGHDFPYPTDE